jgi:hypothetical protein
MKALLGFMPDGHYQIHSFATDEQRKNVVAYATSFATHSAQGGPCPPTGRSTKSDYVYIMQFDGDRIRHMTKVRYHVATATSSIFAAESASSINLIYSISGNAGNG